MQQATQRIEEEEEEDGGVCVIFFLFRGLQIFLSRLSFISSC